MDSRFARPALAGAAALIICHAATALGEEQCPRRPDATALIRCALARSPDVLAARRDLEEARGRRITAGHPVPGNPAIEVGAGHRRADSGRAGLDAIVEIAQPVEIGRQRGARITVADVETDGAQQILDAVTREIVAETLDAALSVVRARAAVRFAAEEREIADRLVQVSAGRTREGVGAALDNELAEAARVQARRNELATAAGLRTAETDLSLVVGGDVQLADEPALPADLVSPADRAQLEDQAVALRAASRSALVAARASRERIALLRRERIPDVTLAAYAKREDFADAFGGRITIPLPLFRRNQGEIAVAEARATAADAASAQAALRVRLEVRAAYDAWQRATAVVREIPPGLDGRLSDDTTALRDAYGRGAMALPVVLASLRETFAARRTLADVRIEALRAALELARAGGIVIPIPENRRTP